MKQETRIKKAAEAVKYEIWMFVETAKLLAKSRTLIQNNAFLGKQARFQL